MSRFSRAVLAVILPAFILVGTAAAEITLPVNDNNTGVFDQPSAVLDGAAVRVAYIGDNSASGVFKVYYAAVNGNFNFQITTPPTDNSYILTRATAVDNSTSPNDAYYDARHPKIAMRSSTEAVILFQAKPAFSDTVYRPYIARLTLSGNTVTSISVRKVVFSTGVLDTVDIEDLSFGIVASDNSARVAFATKSAIGAAETFQVYFARVGLDNVTVVGTPIQLSSLSNTDGLLPLPSLRLDSANRAHIAWVANNATSVSSPVYYAMVKEKPAGNDNNVIQATAVLDKGMHWGFPSLQIFNNSSIIVVAADDNVAGHTGSIGFVNFNPDADDQDGDPVQVANISSFIITPPAELTLSGNLNLYRPEAFLDSSGIIHMVGYGVGGNSRGTYYAFHLVATDPFFGTSISPMPVGSDSVEYPRQISGDYTRPAFVYLSSGKVVAFWAGVVGTTNRNIDVSTVATTAIVTPSEESGCSMVADPRSGERGRMAGAFFLFLPAVVLAVRRISRGRRKARRRTFAG